jgi:hypothetical protein
MDGNTFTPWIPARAKEFIARARDVRAQYKMSVLEIRGLTKTFPGVTALEDVSLSAEAERFTRTRRRKRRGKIHAVKILAGFTGRAPAPS